MLENFFIKYANCSLLDDPSNFLIIYKGLERYADVAPNFKRLKPLIRYIVAFGEMDDPQLASDRLEKEKKKSWDIKQKATIENAFEAVYGYRDGFCEIECPKRSERIRKIGVRLGLREARQAEKGKKILNRLGLKCYECQQLYFTNILTEIAEEKEYSQIEGLRIFLGKRSEFFELEYGILPDSNLDFSPKQTTKDPLLLIEYSHYGPHKFAFQNFWDGLIAFSLSEFLSTNDRRKLKICPYCHSFFTGHVNRQKCESDDCRKTYERLKKQKQRDKDPVTYY